MHLVSIRETFFTQQKQWGLYQNKVNSSLAAILRPGLWTDNCKMVYYGTKRAIHLYKKVLGPGQTPYFTWTEPSSTN